MGEEFLLDIIALLNQQLSKKKIKEQLKGMDNFMFVKVISKLSIGLSQRQLKKDLKQLNDLYIQVGADLKIDSALKKKLQGRIKTLQDSISDLQIGVSTKDSNIAKTVTEARNKGQKVANRTSIDFNIEVKKEKAIADLEYMAKKYSKLFSNASASAKYNNILDAAYGITDAKQLANVRAQIAAFTSELKANNLASQSLGDKWKRLIDRAKDLFSAASAVTLIFSQVKQAVSSYLQLDTAMTNLYKVQDQIASRDQFSGLLTKWNKLAQNLAVTTNSLISSMEAWSKIGFNLDMSEQLAEITSIFEKTAEISNEKATSTLISAAQAFTEIDDLGVDDYVKRVEAVGNKINAIGNKYAIDSEGIADGLQNASAALKVAGNDLNETIALITATNKIYQNPDEGSNMLKVASMRLRGQVDALKSMGEDAEGVSTDLTKIQQQVYELTGNNVNIFEDDENLKSTYQMILEIGEVFDSLNDRSQADLLEVMFGKQRASAGASLLLNYEELEKIKNDSMNAANSMAEEYSKYMESASAHITIFKEKLVETYSTFMSGDLIKYTADIGSGLLDLVNATDLLRHGLVGIVSLNIGKGITSIGALIASTTKQFNMLGSALQQVKNLPVDEGLRVDALEQIGNTTKSLTEKNLKLLLSQRQLQDSDREMILSMHNLTDEEVQLKLQKLGLLSVTKSQTAANVAEAATTGTLKNAMLSLKAVAKEVGVTIKGIFASNPIGIGLMLATTAISMLSTAISKSNEKLEEARRANIESATTASENADKLKDLYNEYNRLASIQDRTTSEEEAFKTAVENITVALGDKAEILKDLTAGTNEYADALARATKEELQDQAVTATIGRKSAEETLQSEIWDKWNGSQVTIDSNDKGKSLSDEAQRAVDIVSDSLKEYETINRTWKNISWDISSDDPTEALEYYNSLVEAREKLVLASENDESLLDTEIYEDLNTAINSMSESLDTYIEKLYEEEKLNYMAQNGIPSVTEEYKAMESALVSAAGSSVDLQDRLKELLTSDFSDLATDIGNVANAVADTTQSIPATISSSIQQIATQLEPQFAKLGEAYQEIFKLDDNGKEKFSLDSIDNSMLESLRQTFAEIESKVGVAFDSSKLEPFFDTLTNGNSTAEQVRQAFNELATAYLYSTDTLEQLNAETADAIEKQLEEMGVQNAAEIVADALTAKTEELIVAKEYLAQTGKDLASATEEERTAFILEQIEAGNCGEALALLQLKKILVNQSTITTAADCQNILALAQAANIGIQQLQQLQTLMNLITQRDSAQASGDSRAVSELNRAIRDFSSNIVNNLNLDDVKVDFSPVGKGAGKAGKDAGKSYKDALKEELSDLDSVISGITGRIDDQISSINSQKDAALSAISEEKEKLEEAKESAVASLENERKKRLEVIEVQRKQIEQNIKAKQKVIDQINEEIENIRSANEERKREIDLQKAKYELERMQNQRTKLVYSSEKGMHYENDSKGIFNAKEQVRQIELEIEIANKEKQIDLIEKEISLLENKLDILDEEEDRVNDFYDNLLKQTESYYDQQIKALEKQRKSTESYFESLITNLENSKSKYQELTEILEKAELSAKLKQLGIDEEALLNGSEEEFNKLKDAYMNIVFQLNQGNDEVLSSLRELSGYEGTAPSMLEDSNGKLDEMNGRLNTSNQTIGTVNSSLGETAVKTSDAATNVSNLNESLSQINTIISEEQTAFDILRQKIDEIITAINEKIVATYTGQAATAIATTTEMACYMLLRDKILEVKEHLDAVNNTAITLDVTPVNALTTAFQSLYDQLLLVSITLGAGMEGAEEGAVGGIASAIQALNEISLEEGIIAQFTNLKTAIDEVTSAIGGGGGGNSEGSVGGQSSGGKSGGGQSGGKGSKGEGGGSNSLTGAIEAMGETAAEVIGEPDAEGDGTVIGEFGALETAVTDVTSAIGGGDSEGGEGQGKGSGGEGDSGEGTLIGSIENLGETTLETLGEQDGDGVIGKFNEFKGVIEEAANQVKSISVGLDEIDGKEVECTITVNVKMNGSIPAFASGTVLGNMQIESATYNAQYGKAFASGTIGLKHDEKNALRSEYGQPELTVYPNGTTELTTSPVMSDLPKGTVIYNEEQTKKIMDNKSNPVGNAHEEGTYISPLEYIHMLQQRSIAKCAQTDPDFSGKEAYERLQKINANLEHSLEALTQPTHIIADNMKRMIEMDSNGGNAGNVNNVTNNRNVQQPIHNEIHVTLPNVTNSTSAESLLRDLQSINTKKFQVNW